MDEIRLERFTETDIPELTAIMKRAFDRDTQIHLGEPEGGPEGYDDGSFLRKWGLEAGGRPLKILLDGRTIGGAIVFRDPKSGTYFLGTIFLDADMQEKGIGTRVWKMIEDACPDAAAWRLDTPGFSSRNHNFYVNKCGFHIVHIDNPRDPRERSFALEKRMKP